MFAEVVSVSAPTSVSAAGGPDCHLMSGCGFPAPGAEIFVFEDIFTLQLASLEFGFSKVTLLLLKWRGPKLMNKQATLLFMNIPIRKEV